MKLWECLKKGEQKNIFLISDGGSGKTYQLLFAYKKMKMQEKIVALYIPLNKYDGSGDYVKDFILREFFPSPDAEKTVADRRDVLLSLLKTNGWRFCLFLDGINETSYSIGTLISEIEELSKIENVSTVVASRFDIDGFKDFKRFKLGKIDESFIEERVENYQTLNPQLKSLLKSPFYLTKYLEITDGEGITCAGELLTKYYESLVEKTGRSRKSCDYGAYCLDLVEKFLPNFAFERMEEGAYLSFNDEDLIRFWNGFCEKKIVRYPAVEDAERALKDLHVIVKAHEGYSFAHEINHTYFAAKFVTDSMKKNREEGDKLLLKAEGSVLQMVGELLGEHKKNAVDRLLDKYRGQFDGTSAEIVAKLIDMRKKVRGYNIKGDYHNLDLTKARFMGYNLGESDFQGAKLDRLCFNNGEVISMIWRVAYNSENNTAYAVGLGGELYKILPETGDISLVEGFEKEEHVLNAYGIEKRGEILVEYFNKAGEFFAIINSDGKIKKGKLLEIKTAHERLGGPTEMKATKSIITPSGKKLVKLCIHNEKLKLIIWERNRLLNQYLINDFRDIEISDNPLFGKSVLIDASWLEACFIDEYTLWFYEERYCYNIKTEEFYQDCFSIEGHINEACLDENKGEILALYSMPDKASRRGYCHNICYISKNNVIVKKLPEVLAVRHMVLKDGIAVISGWGETVIFDFNHQTDQDSISTVSGAHFPFITKQGDKYLVSDFGDVVKLKNRQITVLKSKAKRLSHNLFYLADNVILFCDGRMLKIYKNGQLKKQLVVNITAIDIIKHNGKNCIVFGCVGESTGLGVYDYENEKLKLYQTPHEQPIDDICCYSPEGIITTRSYDKSAFWNVENLQECKIYEGHYKKAAYLGENNMLLQKKNEAIVYGNEGMRIYKLSDLGGFVIGGTYISASNEFVTGKVAGKMSNVSVMERKCNEKQFCTINDENIKIYETNADGIPTLKERIIFKKSPFSSIDEMGLGAAANLSIATCDNEIAIYFNGEISFYDKKGNYKGKINPLVNTNVLDADFRKAKLDPQLKAILEENGGKV